MACSFIKDEAVWNHAETTLNVEATTWSIKPTVSLSPPTTFPNTLNEETYTKTTILTSVCLVLL